MASKIVTQTAGRDFQFALSAGVNVRHLEFNPVNGRRTLYASITLGRRTFWLQRWDTAGCSNQTPFAFSSDRLMCWTAGSRSGS